MLKRKMSFNFLHIFKTKHEHAMSERFQADKLFGGGTRKDIV